MLVSHPWNPQRQGRRLGVLVFLSAFGMALLACAPAQQGRELQREPGKSTTQQERKTLRLGIIAGEEPKEGIALFGPGGTGGPEHTFLLHAGLTIYDPQGNLLARVAETVPSIDAGDWKAFPDGRMEVQWKLRRDVQWHDGTPLTADDYAFGMRVVLDDQIPHSRARWLQLITDVQAPDAHTLVISWKAPYMLANESGPTDILALPRHLAGDLFEQASRDAFINSPLWTRDFVGVGPFRLASWELGSQMELAAFDQYFLGRPKIDRLVIKYAGDANVLNVSLLAGDIDLVPMGSIKPEQLHALRESWAPSGGGTVLAVYSGTRNLRFQYRDPSAPWVVDSRVRKALYHLLDRKTLADTLQYGLTTEAHTIVGPDDPLYQLMEERGFAKYPHDPRAAERLMNEAGWARATDGLYRSGSGSPFTIEVRGSNKAGNLEEGLAVAGQWKAAGLNATASAFGDKAANKDELKAMVPGVLSWPLKFDHTALQGFISSQIPTGATRWKGSNHGGYSDPFFDRLYDQYISTLRGEQRRSLLADLLKYEADNAVSIHLYYGISTNTVAFRKGVRGPTSAPPFQLITAWNSHLWEIE